MIIRAKEISWYHNDKEFKADKPLGVIYMSSIYHCVPANTAKSTDDLNVSKKDFFSHPLTVYKSWTSIYYRSEHVPGEKKK